MSGYVVEEKDGEFVIPLEGLVCSDVISSWARNVLILRSDDSGEVAEVSGLDEAAVKELVMRSARVVRAVATTDSVLHLDFDGGDSVESPSRPDVEAWEVRLRHGETDMVLVVATPGGGKPSYWIF